MPVTKLLVIIVIIAAVAFFAWHEGWIGKAGTKFNESFSVHFLKGQSLYETSNYQEAIAEFDKAVQLDPKDSDAPNALLRKAECYKDLKQPDEAAKTYEKILADYPDYRQRDQVTAALQKLKASQP